MRRTKGWVAALGIVAPLGWLVTLAIAACSDDEPLGAATTSDGGGDVIVQPPPPNFPDAQPPPPDLVSRSPYLSNATLIADVGETTDGAAWRDEDGALYFTVPKSASPLRRLVPGGQPSIVAFDAGATSPVGVATGGGPRLYLTEAEAIVTVELDDAGVVTNVTRTSGLGGTVFGDIAYGAVGDAGAPGASFFVDTSSTAVYRFAPPNDIAVVGLAGDAGRATAIGVAEHVLGADLEIFVGGSVSGAARMTVFAPKPAGPGFDDLGTSADGVPANALAFDTLGRRYVAWAKGVDVIYDSGTRGGGSDGNASLPIAAIPTSITFGGADRKTLFVTTAAGKIYSVKAQNEGIPR